jgi:cytochrome c2
LQHKHQASQVIGKIRIMLNSKTRAILGNVTVPEAQIIQWRNIRTNLHEIQIAAAKVSDVTIPGGSLAEVGGNIVIASTLGQLSYLDVRNRLHPLDTRVPMNIERLRDDPLYKNPLFNITYVRTHDLLAIQTGIDRYDLYASFNRLAGACFEFVVSRIPLEANDQMVRVSGPWRDVWTAAPCVRMKDRGDLNAEQSGGRMVRLADNKILVSVGDHKFDGFYDSQTVSMDPASDLGKLIELDIETGASRHFAMGLRNPQGLTIARDGRIWETEHGPQGGDEVNLMTNGQNYGWPIVTYGTVYGRPPNDWPFNPKPGRHDGYARPRFAFVPSIGISNIVEPDPQEFPNWAGMLVLCSLRARTLYLLRTEGDDIVYAEPILVDRYRLRDVISLKDGRLAILADGGTLLFVRNGDKHRGDVQHIEVSGLSSLPRPMPEEAPPVDWMTATERGRQYFLGTCASCHSLAGEIGAGPPLNGVVGRRIGAIPEYGYSAALSQRHGTWTEPLIGSFIANTKGFAPSTSMPNTGLGVAQAQDIVAYLKTTQELGQEQPRMVRPDPTKRLER